MHILITGAAGMIGRKLTGRLAKDGELNGRQIDKLTLLDVVPPTLASNFAGRSAMIAADLATPGEAARAVEG
ncbi:MAG: D-erythronate dehydrogenase, partial [Xanthobacteraceae bacterium]